MTKRKTTTAAAAVELPAAEAAPAIGKTTKLDRLLELLVRPDGAAIDELMAATGWQSHSIRGAMAGSLRRKGHEVHSQTVEGKRVYRVKVEARP
jgi:Protein of unknown function (DUF3489)